MEELAFWSIVEGCRTEAGGNTERLAQLVLRRLKTLSPDEIVEFEELWFRVQDELLHWPVRDAGTLLLGPFDDESFTAVQDWIVSHGRAVIRRIQEDPDSLVELAADRHNARIDWFCGLPLEAHIAVAGCPFAMDEWRGPEAPTGSPAVLTDEDEARRRFPRLTAYLDENPWIERPWSDRAK
ncbi:DUF4240 domain-containing protein [Micromonospora phytophila]|uniref:DUF4240 domain-containing protein n=1 Tax=Micromonospora phytophila TaxID=709888 RepID=UPI00202F4CC0|nr:DUF4240 domain-containing protein [Micromonospora phytophila]MCM0676131.1 DUF4240 domain-containing protein [Micromonospora phytophila]